RGRLRVEEGEEDRQRRSARRASVGERGAAASGDVGLEVRLCLLELVDEMVLENVELIEVQQTDLPGVVSKQAGAAAVGAPLIAGPRAHVAGLDDHLAAQAALHADRV